MSFGTLPFGVGPLSSSPGGGGSSTDETGGLSETVVLGMTCDATVSHGSEVSDLTRLGFSCDAFVLVGPNPDVKIQPSVWVEDPEITTTWTTDEGIAGVPSPSLPEA